MKMKFMCACGEEVNEKDYQQLLRDRVAEGIIKEIGPHIFQLNSMFTLKDRPLESEKTESCHCGCECPASIGGCPVHDELENQEYADIAAIIDQQVPQHE